MGEKEVFQRFRRGRGICVQECLVGRKKEDGSPGCRDEKICSFFKGQSDKPDVKFQPPHHCFPKCLKEHIPIVMEGMA
jgi:hypothetical protein